MTQIGTLLLQGPSGELPDEEVERRLLRLPGVGPYAAAHIMMMLGRHSRLVLDSWTRPNYARLVGSRTVPDSAIRRCSWGPVQMCSSRNCHVPLSEVSCCAFFILLLSPRSVVGDSA